MKKILIGLLLMITFTGCSQNKTFFKCVNEKMNLNNELGYKNFSYLDSIRKIE